MKSMQRKFSNNDNKNSKTGASRRYTWLFIILCVVILVSGTVIFIQVKPLEGLSINFRMGNELQELWSEEAYSEIVERTNSILDKQPFNVEALRFDGFAHFYIGQSEVNYETQLFHYNQSIQSLRRLLSLDSVSSITGQVHYILGKAYYHAGYYYYDLSLKYFEFAESLGYHQPDSFEYLGLTSAELGLPRKGIEYLLASHEENNRAIILLSVARLYDSLEDFEKTAFYARKAIDESSENYVKEQGFLLAGEGYRKLNNLEEAEVMYLELEELNPSSADAKYYLGEIAAAEGNTVLARALWREAYELNPKHAGAILRLNS
ncbi:tetratricopeptide repeat protein [Spirochaeta lutea]|nr:tetratricopeptide repeat protein [Spirochaeta lutea]